MKKTPILVVSLLFGLVLTLYFAIYIYFDYGRLSLFIYLKYYGAKIICQKESQDGEHIYSLVRITRNNIDYELTLNTSDKGFKSNPVNILQLKDYTIIQILFDSASEAKYKKKHPKNYFPSFCSCYAGICFNERGTDKLFPFRIYSIKGVFDNIKKIDSVFKAIPLYPEILMIRIDSSQFKFFSRTNIKQSKDVLENMKIKVGKEILIREKVLN